MVQRAVPRIEDRPGPKRVPITKTAEEEHAEYWAPEAVVSRERFLRESGEFHISDGFRIVCDAYVDGLTRCGNTVGYAPLPDSHDGLCDRCRSRGFDFPPRIALDPKRVVYPRMPWSPPERAAALSLPRGDAYEDPNEAEDVPPPAEV